MRVEVGDIGVGRLADIGEGLRHARARLPRHGDGVAADRLDLAEQGVAGAGGERRAPARLDAALGDRHRGRHDIDAAQQLVELVGPACRNGRRAARARCARSAQMPAGRGELVAQEQKLLALGQHALVDLEDHRQERGDEQRLAHAAVLADEIVGHALDLDRRHRLALADVGQRVGDVAEEAGELVGRARVDRPDLDLAAHRVGRGGEAAMAAATSRGLAASPRRARRRGARR